MRDKRVGQALQSVRLTTPSHPPLSGSKSVPPPPLPRALTIGPHLLGPGHPHLTWTSPPPPPGAPSIVPWALAVGPRLLGLGEVEVHFVAIEVRVVRRAAALVEPERPVRQNLRFGRLRASPSFDLPVLNLTSTFMCSQTKEKNLMFVSLCAAQAQENESVLENDIKTSKFPGGFV